MPLIGAQDGHVHVSIGAVRLGYQTAEVSADRSESVVYPVFVPVTWTLIRFPYSPAVTESEEPVPLIWTPLANHLYVNAAPDVQVPGLAYRVDVTAVDPVMVGRDPLRKLGAADRICGAARLAMAAGEPTPALALVAAAALRQGQQDPRLQEQIARHGRAGVVARSSRLPDTHPFVHLVLAADRMLDTTSELGSVHAALTAEIEVRTTESPRTGTEAAR